MVPMHVHRALAQMQSKATIRRHALPRVAQRCKTGLELPSIGVKGARITGTKCSIIRGVL
jgi:hypothetical protein